VTGDTNGRGGEETSRGQPDEFDAGYDSGAETGNETGNEKGVSRSAQLRRQRVAAGRPRVALGRGSGRMVTPAIGIAMLIVAASAATSFTWVLANGGVELPARAGTTLVAVATATPKGAGLSPVPSVIASLPTPSPAITLEPTLPPPTLLPPTEPPPTAAPSPTSDRYALLQPCPDKPDCYIYRIRSGDNLFSIARYFGVPLDTVYALNPGLRQTRLQTGMPITLPPPTR
jgi:hypothetical protein